MNNVLIITYYHRSLGFFEDTASMLYKNGFDNLYILQTSNNSSFYGSAKLIKNLGNLTYDQSMVALKKLIKHENYEYLLFLDNDCFLTDVMHLKKYINEFIEYEYDFACHLVSHNYYDQNPNTTIITPVPDLKFIPCTDFPGYIPDPHFENSYMLMRKSAYDKLDTDDVSHGRKFLSALVRKKMKIGAHFANHRLTYTHFGDEWFHIGNLMFYIYALENGDTQAFKKESTIDKSRIGFMLHHNKQYPHLSSKKINESLRMLVDRIGQDNITESYNTLIENTIMESAYSS